MKVTKKTYEINGELKWNRNNTNGEALVQIVVQVTIETKKGLTVCSGSCYIATT